jgi:hypothetical protein
MLLCGIFGVISRARGIFLSKSLSKVAATAALFPSLLLW